MNLFAEMSLNPGGFVAWIAVGLVAGWLAGSVMGGGGYGIGGDIIVGLIGALAGGFLFGFFVHATEGFWGSIVVAFIGACALIGLYRTFATARKRV